MAAWCRCLAGLGLARPTKPAWHIGPGRHANRPPCRAQRFFYFFIFYFHFLQKYIFDMEIYRNIPRPPHCRAAGTWPPGCRAAGAYPKKTRKIIEDRSLVARQGVGCPSPPIWLTKNPEKKEKRGRGEGEAKRQSPVGFSSRRL